MKKITLLALILVLVAAANTQAQHRRVDTHNPTGRDPQHGRMTAEGDGLYQTDKRGRLPSNKDMQKMADEAEKAHQKWLEEQSKKKKGK